MLTVMPYIELLNATAAQFSPRQLFQPYFPNETRVYGGLSYVFSPFSIAGDYSSDGTEAGELELIAPANMISAALLWQASENRYFIRVDTMLLLGTPPINETGYPTYSEAGILSSTICVCDSFGYADAVPDEEEELAVVTLKLANPLNFVAGTSPTRRLTADQVGPLPSSGGITF
jgi:hypothetical protein